MSSRIERLERLDGLRKLGAITDSEFETQKNKLLGGATESASERLKEGIADPFVNRELGEAGSARQHGVGKVAKHSSEQHADEPASLFMIKSGLIARQRRKIAGSVIALVFIGCLSYGMSGHKKPALGYSATAPIAEGGSSAPDSSATDITDSSIRDQFHACLVSSDVQRYKYGSQGEQSSIEDALSMCMRSHGISDERFALYVQRGGQVKFDDLISHCSSHSVMGQLGC